MSVSLPCPSVPGGVVGAWRGTALRKASDQASEKSEWGMHVASKRLSLGKRWFVLGASLDAAVNSAFMHNRSVGSLKGSVTFNRVPKHFCGLRLM